MPNSSAMSTSNQYIKYAISVTVNSQNVINNTSNVTVSVRFYRTNSGYTTYGTGTVYCKINGTTYSASVTSDQKITSSGIVLFSKNLNIAHNADGTKTLATSAWISHSQFTSSEQAYNVALATIPRATTPTLSASSVAMGSALTITMSRASSSFTHTLKYSFGSSSGTIASNLGTSYSWTVPIGLASQIPNATSGTMTISCLTYNGSTLIGTKSVTVTLTVPSTVVPTISAITVTETTTGLASKFGAFIKEKSGLKVAITASGVYSSTISSYSTTFLGKSYTGSSFNIDSVNSSGTLTFSVTVKDSRGRSATTTKTITVLDYESPSVSSFTVVRSDESGNRDDEGNSLLIKYGFNITTLNNKNDKSYTLGLKASGDSSFTTIASGSVYSLNTSLIESDNISLDESYLVKLTVKDYFKEVSYEIEAPTAFTLVDYHSGGKGIAFGKVAEKSNAMEVALTMYDEYNTRVSNGMAFYESGGSTNADTTLEELFLSGVNTPDTSFWFVRQTFYSTKTATSNRTQYAIPYNRPTASNYRRTYTSGTGWSDWIEDPVIVESGTSGIWTYKKWSDGTANIIGQVPISSLAISTALGGWYRSAVIDGTSYAYPFTFSKAPNVITDFATSNGTGALMWLTTQGTTTAPPSFYLIRPTSATGATGVVNIKVEGSF